MTDRNLIAITVVLPPNEVEWLVKEAAQRGVTLTELVSHLLSESIKQKRIFISVGWKEYFLGDGE